MIQILDCSKGDQTNKTTNRKGGRTGERGEKGYSEKTRKIERKKVNLGYKKNDVNGERTFKKINKETKHSSFRLQSQRTPQHVHTFHYSKRINYYFSIYFEVV